MILLKTLHVSKFHAEVVFNESGSSI